jgi:hypothetical protein
VGKPTNTLRPYNVPAYGLILCGAHIEVNLEMDTKNLQHSPSESSPTGVEGKVGHWSFVLTRDEKTRREVWTFQCSLCGYRTRHRVNNPKGYVLPLSGKLRQRRKGHDWAKHPDQAREQDKKEMILLGREL